MLAHVKAEMKRLILMSALTPKADIDWKLSHVHFVPEAVIRLV